MTDERYLLDLVPVTGRGLPVRSSVDNATLEDSGILEGRVAEVSRVVAGCKLVEYNLADEGKPWVSGPITERVFTKQSF